MPSLWSRWLRQNERFPGQRSLPRHAGCGYPPDVMNRKRIQTVLFSLFAMTCMLVVNNAAVAQSSGPRTPNASGSSPLLGYIIAVALGVILVVITMIPSKRHTEDL